MKKADSSANTHLGAIPRTITRGARRGSDSPVETLILDDRGFRRGARRLFGLGEVSDGPHLSQDVSQDNAMLVRVSGLGTASSSTQSSFSIPPGQISVPPAQTMLQRARIAASSLEVNELLCNFLINVDVIGFLCGC